MIESNTSISPVPLVVRRRVKRQKKQNESNLVHRAHLIFAQHPHLKQRRLRARNDKGTLLIEGSVESYFEKQLAQEALKQLAGVISINNQIDVDW